MQAQLIKSIGLIALGGLSSGAGVFRLLHGTGKTRAAVESILLGLGIGIGGAGMGVADPAGSAMQVAGAALAFGVGVMHVRRRRAERQQQPVGR